MTQLVELQKQITEFDTAGIHVYGISYDPQEALKSFSDRYGITYDLLSDVGSVVIRRFGILNTLIDPEDPRAGDFYGIPFPGTYVADEFGVVTEKFFSRHYATRESAGTILDKALGKVLLHEESPPSQRAGRPSQDHRLPIGCGSETGGHQHTPCSLGAGRRISPLR